MALATWKRIIGKSGIWPYEHIVLERDALPELNAALESHTISNLGSSLDKSMVTDVAIGSNTRSVEHVRKRPDKRSRSDRVRLNPCVRMREGPLRIFVNRPCRACRTHNTPPCGNRDTTRQIS